MKIQVHYKNMAMSESIDEFIKAELVTLFAKYQVVNPAADIYLESIRARTENRHPVYSCEVIYKSDFHRSAQKVVRDGRDLFSLITESLDVIEQSLKQMSSRKSDHRRYHRRDPRRESTRAV